MSNLFINQQQQQQKQWQINECTVSLLLSFLIAVFPIIFLPSLLSFLLSSFLFFSFLSSFLSSSSTSFFLSLCLFHFIAVDLMNKKLSWDRDEHWTMTQPDFCWFFFVYSMHLVEVGLCAWKWPICLQQIYKLTLSKQVRSLQTLWGFGCWNLEFVMHDWSKKKKEKKKRKKRRQAQWSLYKHVDLNADCSSVKSQWNWVIIVWTQVCANCFEGTHSKVWFATCILIWQHAQWVT